MLFRDIFREIYYYKIKRMSILDFRIYHLKRIGMNIGKQVEIYSNDLETPEPYLITIGDRTTISPRVSLISHDASASYYIPNSSDLFGRITIGRDCFIGEAAIVLPGITIADNCIVGAGSVVTKSVLKPGTVVAGNPAKFICTVDELKKKNEKFALCVYGKSSRKDYLLKNEDKFIKK